MAEEQKNPGREKFVWITLIVIAVVFIIIISIVKANSPNFRTLPFIILLVVGLVFFFGVGIAAHFFNRKKNPEPEKDEKLPAAITVAQAHELAIKILQTPRYAENIDEILDEGTFAVGKGIKSDIYCLVVKGELTKSIYAICMNMHYPENKWRILINPKPGLDGDWSPEVYKAIQLLATYPEDQPDIRKITYEDPVRGTRQTVEEFKHEDEPKERKEEGGLE